MKKLNLTLSFVFAAAFCTAGNAPAVANAPAPLPAPRVAPAPAVSAAPRVGPAPVVNTVRRPRPAPALKAAPRAVAAPAVSAAPKVKPAVPPAAAPKADAAPVIENMIEITAQPKLSSGTIEIEMLSAEVYVQRPLTLAKANKAALESAVQNTGAESSAAPVSAALPQLPALTTEPVPLDPPPFAKPARAQTPPQAETVTQEVAVAKLIEWDAKLKTLKTDFSQLTEYDGVQISSSTGVLYYSKPAKLRLESVGAGGLITQIAVTDKKIIKMYDSKMQEVGQYKWSQWIDSQPNKTLFDFGNYAALIKEHNVTGFDKSALGTIVLLLEPKTAAGHKLKLTLSARDYFPLAIALEADELVTTAVLQNTQKNLTLQDVFKGI